MVRLLRRAVAAAQPAPAPVLAISVSLIAERLL